MDITKKVKKLIADGETKEAINLLMEYSNEKEPRIAKDATILSSRYSKWKREVTIGVQESSNELRKIEDIILTILDDIKDGTVGDTPIDHNPTPIANVIIQGNNSSNTLPMILGGLGIAALIIASIWMFTGHEDEHSHEPTDPTTKTTTTKKTKPKTKKEYAWMVPRTDGSPHKTDLSSVPLNTDPVKAENVDFVETPSAYYRYIGDKKWAEENSVFQVQREMKEMAQDEWSVYLVHEPSSQEVQIDLYQKTVYNKEQNQPRQEIGKITNSFSSINAAYLKKVAYKDGAFTKKEGEKKWEETNKQTGNIETTYNEIGRDKWAVYISNDKKNLRLDLHYRKIFFIETESADTEPSFRTIHQAY